MSEQETKTVGNALWNETIVPAFAEAIKFMKSNPRAKLSKKEQKKRKARRAMQKASRG